MELIITEKNEYLLKLYNKTIPAEKLESGEGYSVCCSIEDLKDQNGLLLPVGLGIIVIEGPMLNKSPYFMITLVKEPSKDGIFIRLSYHLFSNSKECKKFYEKDITILRRFTQKCAERFKLFGIHSEGYSLERYIPQNSNIHAAIIEDLTFSEELFAME